MPPMIRESQCAQPPGSTSLHFCPLADCSTLRQRALFRQRVERDYKPQLGAKAMGLYGSIWRCAGNESLRAIIGLERLMADNGIKSKGGLYPHLRRLEAAGLIASRKRTTPSGSRLANEYTLLDPYIPRLQDLSSDADFLRNGGSKNDRFLGINSPPFREAELIYLDLADLDESEMSMAERTPPSLPRAATTACVSHATTAVVLSDMRMPVVNELDVAYKAIPEAARPELEAAAQRRLDTDGVPGWMRIAPMIRDTIVRIWLGKTERAGAEVCGT